MRKQRKHWQTLSFLGSKTTANSDSIHEIKRQLLLGRKAMTNLDSILKSRDITLLTKLHIVKDMFFPVVMYGCESWATKKAESWRIDAFKLWCWRRLLRVHWTARRSNQSIIKDINPEYSLEVSCECMFLGSLSRHNKDLEWRTLKPPQRVTALRSWTDRVIALRSRKDHVIALRQISVTALFYLEDSRKIHLQGVRARRPKDTRRRAPQRTREREKERERES